jgi:hypothetical protein
LHIEDANYSEFELFTIDLFPIFNYISSINLKTKIKYLNGAFYASFVHQRQPEVAVNYSCPFFLSIYNLNNFRLPSSKYFKIQNGLEMFYFIFSIQPKNALYGQNFSPS